MPIRAHISPPSRRGTQLTTPRARTHRCRREGSVGGMAPVIPPDGDVFRLSRAHVSSLAERKQYPWTHRTTHHQQIINSCHSFYGTVPAFGQVLPCEEVYNPFAVKNACPSALHHLECWHAIAGSDQISHVCCDNCLVFSRPHSLHDVLDREMLLEFLRIL